MYHSLKSFLDSDDPYAPYDSLSFLIGHKNAAFFCTQNNANFSCRPPPIPTSSTIPSNELDLIIDL